MHPKSAREGALFQAKKIIFKRSKLFFFLILSSTTHHPFTTVATIAINTIKLIF